MSSNKSSKKRKNEIINTPLTTTTTSTANINKNTTQSNDQNQNKKLKSTTTPQAQPSQPTSQQQNIINIKDINSILNNSTAVVTNTNTNNSAESWDGESPIENLTIGQLISSLNGRQHQLRIIVAEYMNSLNKLIGFTEKTPYLLNWVLDNLSKSFINWKQPEKAEQLIQKGIEPLFFEERYWVLLESLVNKQILLQQQLQNNDNSQSSTSTTSNSIKLSNDYLQFIFEIILNSTRNIDLNLNILDKNNTNTATATTSSSKKKKNINIPYQLTSSPPPPLKLLNFSKRISIQLIKIYSSDELMKEIPLLLESLIPLFIKYTRSANKNNKNSSEKHEVINSILDLYQTLFQYLLTQTKLGINYKSMFTTILTSLLPHILTLENALNNIQSTFTSSTQLIETIDDLLKWTLYHPDSHWDSYPYILFSDWLKKIVKENLTTTASATTKENEKDKKGKDNSKVKPKENESTTTTVVDTQIYQPQLILDRLSQLINNNSTNDEISKIVCFNENQDSINSIVMNSLNKFLKFFIQQYEGFGYRHFKDINQWYEGNHKDEKFIEFAYFRKLFSLVNSPTLLKNNPIFYQPVSNLLNQVSLLNIFHISNRHQVDYLSNTVAKSYYLLLALPSSTNNATDEITTNGVYKCLTSLIKISNTLIGNKLKDIIMPHIFSMSSVVVAAAKNNQDCSSDNGRCEFLKSAFDSYFEIRQTDTLLTMIFQSIIKVRSFGTDYKSTLNQEFLQHISRLFSDLPFGQVPIIWNLFLDEWKGYYTTQLNESDNELIDPMLSNRLENFIKLWTTFLDGITISSFVYKMILQLLPKTYQSIVDPVLNEVYKSSSSSSKKSKKSSSSSSSNILNLLNLYSSFLQVHSFIHRQTIISSTNDKNNGENEYGYHPQQFYYYQLCEKELEFSKVIEYLVNNHLNTTGSDGHHCNNFSIITSKLLVQRVQQLHSILSSVSITNYKRNHFNKNNHQQNTTTIKNISSLSNQQFSPKDIETELFDVVSYLLGNFINLVNESSLLFKKYDNTKQIMMIQDGGDLKLNLAIIQSKLLIDNISTWCEYSTIENIQNILKYIISPPIEINNQTNSTTTTTTIYSQFQKLLSNPLFFELKVFQNNFPIVLCQMERDIITKDLIKSSKLFDKLTEIFNDVQERLINSGTLTPSNTSYAEIIIEIQDCFSKKLTIKDFNLTDSSKWERLTWLVSLAPSFHPLYIPIELIGPLVLSSIVINHIGVLLLKQHLQLKQQQDGSSNSDDFDFIYKLILSSRRFIKFCFEKDQSRLVQIIPMNIWIDLIFSSRMFESIDTKYPILFTSLEIQHHYNNELWKHSPMELKKLADKIMNKKSSSSAPVSTVTSPTMISTPIDIITIKPYLIAGILKSISTSQASTSGYNSDILPPDLQSIIKSVEPEIEIFYQKMFNHCSVDPSFNNVAPFFNEYQAEFSLLVYHLWYQLYFNAIDNESLSKLLTTVSFSGVFISSLTSDNVNQYSLILQNSTISLLDLFSRWYSKIAASVTLASNSLMIDSLHALSLLSKMLSLYPEDSKLLKSITSAIIQFFQLNNQLGYLLNSIVTTMESKSTVGNNSRCTNIQLQSFNLLGYFIISIIGTKRINLLKNPIRVVTAIVNIINQTDSESLIISGLNLLCKLMSINVIDTHGDSIPIILGAMTTFSSPFIYSTPVRSISSFNTETITNCPMSLFNKEITAINNNNITPSILNSIYKLLYIILKFRNNELSKYISSFVSSLRFLLYSVANESNRSLLNNEKSIKKVGRLLEAFSTNKNCDLYFQYLIVDYVQLVRYSTTAINNNNNEKNNNNNNINNNSKKQYVGPQYHLSTEMRNLLLPGIFSLVEKSNSNSNKDLFQSLEDTGKGIFQNIISQYQSYKYTGK